MCARARVHSIGMHFATLIVTEPTVHNLGTALDRDITTELVTSGHLDRAIPLSPGLCRPGASYRC